MLLDDVVCEILSVFFLDVYKYWWRKIFFDTFFTKMRNFLEYFINKVEIDYFWWFKFLLKWTCFFLDDFSSSLVALTNLNTNFFIKNEDVFCDHWVKKLRINSLFRSFTEYELIDFTSKYVHIDGISFSWEEFLILKHHSPILRTNSQIPSKNLYFRPNR